jgi:hypothetical protein
MTTCAIAVAELGEVGGKEVELVRTHAPCGCGVDTPLFRFDRNTVIALSFVEPQIPTSLINPMNIVIAAHAVQEAILIYYNTETNSYLYS